MTQVLRTLNRTETSRFEAYRRSALSSSAISDWLVHLLGQAHEHSTAKLLQPRQAPLPTRLVDMVCPGQAGDINTVVSTLAKRYAQRLVTAARRVATAQGYTDASPLLPHHILAAHDARTRAGLDPGFFLQKVPWVGGMSTKLQAAALGNADRDQQLRDAALQAQEEYDLYMESRAIEDENGCAETEEEEPVEAHEEEEMEVEPEKEIAVPPAPVSAAEADDESSMQLEAMADPMEMEMEEELTTKEKPEMTVVSSVAAPTLALPVTAAPIVVTVKQPVVKTEAKSEPLSMEDALLLDMDDDDSSDED